MWRDGIVPVTVELIWGNPNGSELGVGDFDSFFVGGVIDCGTDTQPLLGCGCSDKVDDHFMAYQWLTPPVQTNKRKQSVFDFVPLAGGGREVAHSDYQAKFVGELL